jgi:hypothetical protein
MLWVLTEKLNQFQPYEGKKHDFDIYKDQKNRDRFPGVPKKADAVIRE